MNEVNHSCFFRFLSTPSARRATLYVVGQDFSAQFLSTPSARRATKDTIKDSTGSLISIHALREEGDFSMCAPMFPNRHFYPRPPRGGRHHRRSLVKLV